MKKALNWCIVLVCAIAVLAGFAALLPQMTEAAGCFQAHVGCCNNHQSKFFIVCPDGRRFVTCSAPCLPVP